jgi:hypothetical protein
VKRPVVPAGAAHPVDAFIRERLAREGILPSPAADKRTLLRRVTLDLTGLPPTTAEINDFLNDRTPGAYEKVVDRLLASPRYAEKQAMHWLDNARYADTCGFHGDNPFPAWPYRDYVLRAFRDNKPFDVFTREQLAGDLLPDAGIEGKIASAFNRMNRTSAEGGVQPKEYLAKYAADRVRTIAATWLGSTMGCAECHDHKFDPFTAKDFYSMKAFFADIKETGLVPDKGPKAWGSQLSLPDDGQKTRLAELTQRVEEAERALEEKTREVAARRAGWEKELLAAHAAGQLAWRFQRPVSAKAERGATLQVFNDEPVDSAAFEGASLVSEKRPGEGLVVASGANPDNETYTIAFQPGEGSWTALGLEIIPDESLPGVRFARGADRLVVTEIEAHAGSQKLAFVLGTSSVTFTAPEHPTVAAFDGDPKTGWGVATYGDNGKIFLALRFANKVVTKAGETITVRIAHDSEFRKAAIGRFRLALSSAEHSWPTPEERRRKATGLPRNVAAALSKAERTEEEQTELFEHLQFIDPELQPGLVALTRLRAEQGVLEASIPRVVITEATEPEVTRVLARGNWMDESGEVVEPAVPGFLGKLPVEGRATRLDLANWLVSRDNPLTARVYVNRQWRLLFGTGLSKVLDDIGSQGEWPTHPELLDWLAAEFIESADGRQWDMKGLVRTIVSSETYKQSSRSTPQLDERDPDNRLLARQSRLRVDAEMVRDIALAASGLLSEKFGGPSVRPYQPEGYLGALNFPKREYPASHGADLYRRGLYVFWQRTFLHPSLATFDAPTREECQVNRSNSNTPLQALVLLNDPIYVEAARVFAQNILREGGKSVAARIDWAFERAINRKPDPGERQTLEGLYRASRAYFGKNTKDAALFVRAGDAPLEGKAKTADLAALETVARAILNLHETITRN